jgi:hypothetical protein
VSRSLPSSLVRLLLALALWLGPSLPAWAQPAGEAERPQPYFVPGPPPAIVTGELTTPRFRLLHTARAERTARDLAGRIEQARDRFAEVLGRDWPGVTEIRIGVGREEFEKLALPGGHPPGWAVALAYPNHNIILLDALSLSRPGGEMTLRHELSHVALGQLAEDWPRWFQEGVAMYLTGDRFSLTQYTALFRAVTQDKIFDFGDLSRQWPEHPGDVEIAYAQSVAFVAHLAGRFGPERLGQLIDHVRDGAHFEIAFARAFGVSLGVEQSVWEEDLPNRYSWTPVLTGGSMVWAVASLLLVIGWLRRRRVLAARKAQMAAQEAAEEAALRLATASLAEDASLPESDPWLEEPTPQLPRSLDEPEDGDDPERPSSRRLLH